MPSVRWTPEALRDVQRLYRFLASKNRVAARRAIQAIRTQVQVLVQHPAVGRLVEAMDPMYREWRIALAIVWCCITMTAPSPSLSRYGINGKPNIFRWRIVLKRLGTWAFFYTMNP